VKQNAADHCHNNNSNITLPLTQQRSTSPTELSTPLDNSNGSVTCGDMCMQCNTSQSSCVCHQQPLLSLPMSTSARATSPQPLVRPTSPVQPTSPSSPSSPQSLSSPISSGSSISSSSSSPRSPITFNFSSPPSSAAIAGGALPLPVLTDLLQLPLTSLPYQPVPVPLTAERPGSPPSSPELLSLPTSGKVSPINGAANGMVSLTSPSSSSNSGVYTGYNGVNVNVPFAQALASMTLANGLGSLPLSSSMSYEYLQQAAQQQALLWASIMCPTPMLPMNMNRSPHWSLPFGNSPTNNGVSQL
jgi:hypothetical protein